MLGTDKRQWAQAASGEFLSRLTKYSSLWEQLNVGMGHPASIKRIEIPNVNWWGNRHQCFFFLLIGHESGAMCEWLVVLLHKNTTLLVLCYFKVHQVTLKHIWAQIPPLPPGRREVRFAMKLIPAHCCIFFPSDNLFSFSKTLELAFFPGAHWAVPEKGFHSSLLFHGRAVQMLWVPSPGSGHF